MSGGAPESSGEKCATDNLNKWTSLRFQWVQAAIIFHLFSRYFANKISGVQYSKTISTSLERDRVITYAQAHNPSLFSLFSIGSVGEEAQLNN